MTSAFGSRNGERTFRFDRVEQNFKIVQSSYKPRLLCFACEQFLNDSYEKPFHGYWSNCKALDQPIHGDHIELHGFDYRVFKLLHLTILWRFMVSKLGVVVTPGTEDSLSFEAERLRTTILSGDPGPSKCNAVFPVCVVDPKSRMLARAVVVPPVMEIADGFNLANTLYDGFSWAIYLAPESLADLKRYSIKSHGYVRCRVKSIYDYPEARRLMLSLPAETRRRAAAYIDRLDTPKGK